jgi:hypothetical protein
MEQHYIRRSFAAMLFDLFGKHRQSLTYGCAEPYRAKDSRITYIDVSTSRVFVVPWFQCWNAFVPFRFKQLDVSPLRETSKPRETRRYFVRIMIAFDNDDGDSRFFKSSQADHRVICSLRIDIATIEQVSGDQHEIDSATDCVSIYHILPRAKEIACAVRQVVAFDAEMYVRYMKESGHDLTTSIT